MAKTLYWVQGGACGGDSMAMLDAGSPNVLEFLRFLDIEVLWHPSLSVLDAGHHEALVDDIVAGKRKLDFLCVEGSVIRGPGGTGMYDAHRGRAKKDLVEALAHHAEHVIAVGTCASFGGIGADGDIEATGLTYTRQVPGGFLGADFRSGAGGPVVTLPGCPCHGEVLMGTLMALAKNAPLPLNEMSSPQAWFGIFVHQGCVRNEYHEYRVEERDFGERGCMFFHLGCRGPIARGPCNKLLWNNRRSSKLRVGVPCLGCTMPDFPQPNPFFRTLALAEVPLVLPDGVDRAHYLAYKGMAAAAAPERLKKRITRV